MTQNPQNTPDGQGSREGLARLTTCLMLPGQSKEAAEFYGRVFGVEPQLIEDGQGGVMLATVQVGGATVTILNNDGPDANDPSTRVSHQLHVDGQEEFDRYWDALLDGGRESHNGWLVDRFGIWWSIVPVQQIALFHRAAADPAAIARLSEVSRSQGRIDLARMEAAVEGR